MHTRIPLALTPKEPIPHAYARVYSSNSRHMASWKPKSHRTKCLAMRLEGEASTHVFHAPTRIRTCVLIQFEAHCLVEAQDGPF